MRKNNITFKCQTARTYGLTETGNKVKQSLYRPVTGPEGSRRFRLPDFKKICT